MIRCLMLACFVVIATSSAQKPPSVAWQAEYEATLDLAKKKGRPIMVAFILEAEPSCEEICGEHFLDEAVIEMSRRFECLLAFASFESPDAKGETTNSGALVRSLEGRVSSEQLAAIESDARGELMESNRVSTPQFVFLKPDGETVLLRHVWMLTPEQLLRKMQMAYHFFDPKWPLPAEAKKEAEADEVEISELMELCNSNNMNTRREALPKLAVKDHPDVIAFIVKQTHEDMPQQRRLEAIRAMGQAGQAKYLERLHRLLVREKTFQIRSNVADAIKAVGLVESVPALAAAVRKEKKDNVRSLLLRALAKCSGKEPGELLNKALIKALKSSSAVDRITALSILADLEPDPAFEKPILGCVKNRSAQVRTAAYLVVGKHRMEKAATALERRFSSEKQARKACGWALSRLGISKEGAFEDPSSEISGWLPHAAY